MTARRNGDLALRNGDLALRSSVRTLVLKQEPSAMLEKYASLAAQLGVAPRTVQRWVRGDTKPMGDYLQRLEVLARGT